MFNYGHCRRKVCNEILARLEALEKKVILLITLYHLMRRHPVHDHIERLVDIVVEHDITITEIVEHTVTSLTDGDLTLVILNYY